MMKQYLIITDQSFCSRAFPKYLKKVVFLQTYNFCQREKLLYHSQYGFRNEYSTEFTTLEIVDRLMIE